MNSDVTFRRARLDDIGPIVALLVEDELGKTRESTTAELDKRYIDAFNKIDSNYDQFLMVAELGSEVVGTCHLTIIPSLTFIGSTRLQVEGVRVAEKCRGRKIGEMMMQAAISFGKSQGALIIQLTTNKQRHRAKNFYERLGFEASHEGMKLYI